MEEEINKWLQSNDNYKLIHGDSQSILPLIPDNSIHTIITSPPYWQQRSYNNNTSTEFGLEETVTEYVQKLLSFTEQFKRVLRPDGSFWLVIGDTYKNKNLVGTPWRTAIQLQDEQDWILRNDVIWNKVKGNPSSADDRLRVMTEHVFHFVLNKDYYYDMDSIRENTSFQLEEKEDGTVVSPTGVSGKKYRQQIQESSALTEQEKENALDDLEKHIQMLKKKEIKDYRMVIRDTQRTTHGSTEQLSGRAKELAENGYYFLRYNADGAKPGNIWDIIPESTHRNNEHDAVYPVEICEKPIKATCPQNGIVLDPFCGTGTTIIAANKYGRRAIGIEQNKNFIEETRNRLNKGIQQTFDGFEK